MVLYGIDGCGLFSSLGRPLWWMKCSSFHSNLGQGLRMRSQRGLPKKNVTNKNVGALFESTEKKQVRVLAVKKSRVECVIADQPEFQKRPFSDYQVGDLVEGTVITVRARAAFVDVGAMQQGYLPEENVKGQKLEEGQKIKLKVETVTGCRMTLLVP